SFTDYGDNGAQAPSPVVQAPPEATGGAPILHKATGEAPVLHKATGGAPILHNATGEAPVLHEATGEAPVLHKALQAVPGNAVPLRGAASKIVSNMEASLAVPTATPIRNIPVKALEDN